MSSTYSINPGTPTEAFKLTDLTAVLNELPDNTQKLINPHDIRDAIYTSWENIVFKPTSNNTNIEYVGIDRDDFFEKILLGKKETPANDTLSAGLLNSDIDIFFYNNKSQVDINKQNTSIGILSGNNNNLFFYGNTVSIPIIESKVVTTLGGEVLQLDIKNSSNIVSGLTSYGGNINIYTNNGNVLVNGIIFPKLSENIGVSDGYVLSAKNGNGGLYAQWTPNTSTVTSVSQSGTFSITANPFLINGYDAMFSSSVPTPTSFGGIAAGSTFSNVAVTEMIRSMLYPYIQPTLTLTPYTPIVEVRSSSLTLTFSYTIIKYVASSTISTINSSPIFTTNDFTAAINFLNAAPTSPRSYTGTTSFVSPGINSVLSFTLSARDSSGTYSVRTTVTPVYPIFYGTTTVATNSQSGVQSILGTFSKILSSNPNQTVVLGGNGVCIYYLVPRIYNLSGSMSGFYEGSSASFFDLKNVFRGNATPFTMSLTSPSSLWSNIVYNCYIYSPLGNATTTTIGTEPLYSATYQFLF
jgi:hypothetical protein